MKKILLLKQYLFTCNARSSRALQSTQIRWHLAASEQRAECILTPEWREWTHTPLHSLNEKLAHSYLTEVVNYFLCARATIFKTSYVNKDVPRSQRMSLFVLPLLLTINTGIGLAEWGRETVGEDRHWCTSTSVLRFICFVKINHLLYWLSCICGCCCKLLLF